MENFNLNNYSFKINADNSPNKLSFFSKEKSPKKLLNNYLSVNKIPKENNNNLTVSFLEKQLSHKKSFVTECEWDKKSSQNISSLNDNNINEDMSFQSNNFEKKIIESINRYNSSCEQNLKTNKIRQKQDFNNIKNEVINKNFKKKEKNKTKEKTVQDYEYCLIF